MKKRVTSIGGIFFKTKDPKATKEWYAKHLGFNTDDYGTSFEWRKTEKPEEKGFSAWSPMKDDTTYFEPSEKQFMVNYRVEDLEWLVETLKKEGVTVCDAIETFEYGKFVHIMDNDGNKIELWEANDDFYDKMVNGKTTK
jgi:predicted enzyme related to lactoylglutathione lyase